MQTVLLVAGVLSLYPLRQLGTGLLLILLTLANATLGLNQEGRAASAVAALQKMMIVKARVFRDGHESEISAEGLVLGDLVSIEAGDIVPADGRLLQTSALEVAESALTGESLPVAKGPSTIDRADAPLGDRTDMVYMNTSVTHGTAKFVVTATGMTTEVGGISGMIQPQSVERTPLSRQLDQLSKLLLALAGGALLASMALNLSRGYTFNTVFNAAVAFAIAAVPVQLPTVVTTILAWGTQSLARAGAIMKQLRSTETLGSTSAINSDKTGTLTLNEMTAVQMGIPGRQYAVEGAGYSTVGQIKRVAGQADVPLDEYFMPMILASDAVVRDGELIGDPTEGALVVLAAKGGIDAVATRKAYPRVAQLPFDSSYKLMATFHAMTTASGTVIRCFVKGAPEVLLARAVRVLDADAGTVPLDNNQRQAYLEENERLATQGLRVIGTARRDLDPDTFDPEHDLLRYASDLELLSLVGMVDPPRPDAKASVAEATRAGITVRMITGDHEITAASIAHQLGIDGSVLSGGVFSAMSDEEAIEAIDKVGVIARVSAEDKVRLVDLLKRKGQTVAMTGDGVNDAPALQRADIGIAMGITGTEVARQAAADGAHRRQILHHHQGGGDWSWTLRQSRSVHPFRNGVHVRLHPLVLGGSIFDVAQGEPLLPLQILWVAFTTVTLQSVGLGYSKPATGLMVRPPRPPKQPILSRATIVWLVFAGLVISVGTLSVISWGEQTRTLALARTMGMVTFSLSNLFFSIESKDEKASALSLETFSDNRFLTMTAVSFFLLVMSTALFPFQRVLRTTPLDLNEWLLSATAALPIVAAAEIQKALWRRKSA